MDTFEEPKSEVPEHNEGDITERLRGLPVNESYHNLIVGAAIDYFNTKSDREFTLTVIVTDGLESTMAIEHADGHLGGQIHEKNERFVQEVNEFLSEKTDCKYSARKSSNDRAFEFKIVY